MKTRFILIAALLMVPAMALAQGTVNDLETDLGARIGVTFDKKISKGFHISAGGEWRLTDNFTNPGRVDAGIGLDYKINNVFKVGAGYTLINKQSSSGTWKMRHRAYLDAKATLAAGDWRFSLKECLQVTHKDVNTTKHQTTPNSLELKTRLKASYKGFGDWTPYGYVEMRNVFNDPACTAVWSTTSQAYGGYEFLGYTDGYINRLRGSIGTEWKVSKQSSFDFYLLADYLYEKEIDTYASGTMLRSLTYDQTFRTSFCVGYKFSF